jgi:DNA-binding LytR/AlgR family response regulator
MRVEQRQVKDQPLTVIVEYPEYDQTVERLVNKIKNLSISFTGKADGKTFSIDISDIYYIENVERKIFLYSKKDIYRFDGNMTDIDQAIVDTDLVRISRTCFMNVSHLREIMQMKNSHLEAVLDNGEKLIVSRKYLKDIKKIFRRKLL